MPPLRGITYFTHPPLISLSNCQGMPSSMHAKNDLWTCTTSPRGPKSTHDSQGWTTLCVCRAATISLPMSKLLKRMSASAKRMYLQSCGRFWHPMFCRFSFSHTHESPLTRTSMYRTPFSVLPLTSTSALSHRDSLSLKSRSLRHASTVRSGSRSSSSTCFLNLRYRAYRVLYRAGLLTQHTTQSLFLRTSSQCLSSSGSAAWW